MMALLTGSHIYRSLVFFAEILLLVSLSDLIEDIPSVSLNFFVGCVGYDSLLF